MLTRLTTYLTHTIAPSRSRGTFPILFREPDLSRKPPIQTKRINGSGFWKERGLKRTEKESTPRNRQALRLAPLKNDASAGHQSTPGWLESNPRDDPPSPRLQSEGRVLLCQLEVHKLLSWSLGGVHPRRVRSKGKLGYIPLQRGHVQPLILVAWG